MFDYIINHPHEVLTKVSEHIELTLLAVSIAVLIGIPLGILSASKETLGRYVLNIINIIQTIPSLALFGFLLPLPFVGGIGARPAITVLFLYALLPIVKSTYVGIQNVERSVIEAARGIGMTPAQRLWIVKLPIAFPIIMSGIRMSSVLTVGTVTIAAIIGAGGLGDFIYRGTSTLDYGLITAGTFPAIILALITDRILEVLEKRINISSFMKKMTLETPRIVLAIIALIVLGICGGLGYTYYAKEPVKDEPIKIGVKNLTENRIIGQVLKIYLENKLKKPVIVHNLSSTPILFKALSNRNIDLCMEYTGTTYMAVLKQEKILPPDETLKFIKDALRDQYGITVFDPLGFQNNFAFAMRASDAQKYKIRTLSELRKYAPSLVIGTTSECHDRYDGLRGLKEFYGLKFKSEKIVELGIRYKAIAQKEVDIIDAFTTDGFMLTQNLAVLEDDKHFFPPYYGVIQATEDFLKKYPEATDLLNALNGFIDDHTMQTLNYQADVEKRPIDNIAQTYLLAQRLIENIQ